MLHSGVNAGLEGGADALNPGRGNLLASRGSPRFNVIAVDMVNLFILQEFKLSFQDSHQFIGCGTVVTADLQCESGTGCRTPGSVFSWAEGLR